MSGIGSGRGLRGSRTIDFIDVSDVYDLVAQALITSGDLDPTEIHELEVQSALRAAMAQVYGN